MMVIDSFVGRFSSHPGAAGGGDRDAAIDLTRATPFARWDVDMELPGVVSHKPGSRFGRHAFLDARTSACARCDSALGLPGVASHKPSSRKRVEGLHSLQTCLLAVQVPGGCR